MSYVSNYYDSGYTITPSSGIYINTGSPNRIYDTNNVAYTSDFTVPSADIYSIGTQSRVGVYMISGSYNSACTLYPVICSTSNLAWIGVNNADDNAWLLYPGYGIQLYTDVNDLTLPISYVYYNNTTSPKVLGCTTWGSGPIINRTFATGGGDYPKKQTTGIRVYFRNSYIPEQI